MSKRLIAGIAGIAVVAGIALYLTRRGGGDESENTAPKGADRGAATPGRASASGLPAPGGAAGTVTAADGGAVVAGAIVALTPTGDATGPGLDIHALTATTGEDGTWSMADLPPGTYAASASASGYLPAVTGGVSVATGSQTTGIDFSLPSGGHALRGAVSDISGGPIAGAVVRVTPLVGVLAARDEDAFAAVTDSDGNYEVRVGEGRYRAEAMHAEYVASARLVEVQGGDATVDFALAPGGIVEGIVRDEATGKPVPNARVSYAREALMSMYGGGSVATDGRSGWVVAGDDGTFSVRGLRSGSIRLAARAEGSATREPTIVGLGIAEHVSGVEVFVGGAYEVSGKVVVAETGQPAEGVTVFARGEAGGAKSVAPTGPDGGFAIRGLVPGGYSLRAQSDNHVPTDLGKAVSVDDGDVRDVVVEVGAGAMIRGRVEPRIEAEVSIQIDTETGSGFRGGRIMQLASAAASDRTGDDGEFALGPLTPGKHLVAARAADGRKGTLEVTLTKDGASDVVIRLEDAATVSGRVIDAAGEPVGGATVSLKTRRPDRNVTIIVNGRDMTANQAPTHADGSFQIRGVDAGDYSISVADARGDVIPWAKPSGKDKTAPIELSVAEAENKTDVTLEVEERDGVLEGVVLGPKGSPAPDVWVTATPSMGGGMGLPPLRRGGPPPDEPAGPPPTMGGGNGDEDTEVRSTMMVVAETNDGGGGGELGLSGSLPPVLTDGDGRFRIDGLRKGRYEIMAEGVRGTARGFARDVDTGSDIEVRLVSLTAIEGKVVTDAGEVVPRFRVELSGASMRSKQVRDDDGSFTLRRIDPGEYEVRVTTDDGSGKARVTVVDGKTAEVTVTLATMSTITGIVVDPAGNPVAGVDVLVGEGSGGSIAISMEDGEEPARTRDDGSFTLRVPAGPHILLIMGADSPRPRLFEQLDVEAGQDLDLGTLTTTE